MLQFFRSFSMLFYFVFSLHSAAESHETGRTENPIEVSTLKGGITFSDCNKAEREKLNRDMRAYFNKLGLPQKYILFSQEKNTLNFSLNNDQETSNTLNLCDNKEFEIEQVKETYTNRDGDEITIHLPSEKEILIAMLQRGRTSHFPSPHCDFKEILSHIRIRQNIVRWGKHADWDFPEEKWGEKPTINLNFWSRDSKNEWVIKNNVDVLDALKDAFIGPKKYFIGCTRALELAMTQGVVDYFANDLENPHFKDEIRKIAGSKPVEDAETKYLQSLENVPGDNWIPGDWGWIKNTDEASAEENGYEGANILYGSCGEFVGYYERSPVGDLAERLRHVYEWRQSSKRKHWNDNLVSKLMRTPEEGGILTSTRDFPKLLFTYPKNEHETADTVPNPVRTEQNEKFGPPSPPIPRTGLFCRARNGGFGIFLAEGKEFLGAGTFDTLDVCQETLSKKTEDFVCGMDGQKQAASLFEIKTGNRVGERRYKTLSDCTEALKESRNHLVCTAEKDGNRSVYYFNSEESIKLGNGSFSEQECYKAIGSSKEDEICVVENDSFAKYSTKTQDAIDTNRYHSLDDCLRGNSTLPLSQPKTTSSMDPSNFGTLNYKRERSVLGFGGGSNRPKGDPWGEAEAVEELLKKGTIPGKTQFNQLARLFKGGRMPSSADFKANHKLFGRRISATRPFSLQEHELYIFSEPESKALSIQSSEPGRNHLGDIRRYINCVEYLNHATPLIESHSENAFVKRKPGYPEPFGRLYSQGSARKYRVAELPSGEKILIGAIVCEQQEPMLNTTSGCIHEGKHFEYNEVVHYEYYSLNPIPLPNSQAPTPKRCKEFIEAQRKAN